MGAWRHAGANNGTITDYGLGILGGLILNIMPCVLPVLTMKIFGLVEHSGASAAENRKQGIAYTGGILLSFLIFAAVIVAIKASGERVGWGMKPKTRHSSRRLPG